MVTESEVLFQLRPSNNGESKSVSVKPQVEPHAPWRHKHKLTITPNTCVHTERCPHCDSPSFSLSHTRIRYVISRSHRQVFLFIYDLNKLKQAYWMVEGLRVCWQDFVRANTTTNHQETARSALEQWGTRDMTLTGSVCRQKVLITALQTSNTDGATWGRSVEMWHHFVAPISDPKQYRNVGFMELKEH